MTKVRFHVEKLIGALVVSLMLISPVMANSPGIAPVFDSSFEIEPDGLDAGKFTVFFSAESNVYGSGNVELILPDGFETSGGGQKKSRESFTDGGLISRRWTVEGSGSGIRMIQVNFNLDDTQNQENEPASSFHCAVHYIELATDKVVADFKQVPQKWITSIDEIDNNRTQAGMAVGVDPVLVQDNDVRIEETYNKETNDYSIYIMVSGRLNYFHGQNCFAASDLGIPGHRVWLEWDYDHDPNTGYWPYLSDERHIYYDETADDGSYYFSFYFISPNPASYYSDQLRIYARRSNSAAYAGANSPNESFPVMGYVDISTATSLIYETGLDLTQDPNHGGALRGLYLGYQFSVNELGYDPGYKVRYYLDFNCSNSFYSRDGDNGSNCGPDPGIRYILFNRYPDGPVSAHEYGHFIDHAANGFMASTNNPFSYHTFTMETDYGTAWVEGWAEFFGASTMMHYYSQLLDGYYDGTSWSGEYTFIEYAERSLVSLIANRYKVEGAVASMLHACWDDAETRSLGYSGDNESVVMSGASILAAFSDAESTILPSSYYVGRLLTSLASQQPAEMGPILASLKTYYFDNQAYPPTSRSPHSSGVTGTNVSRTISWTDETSPYSVSLNGKRFGSCNGTFYLNQNNESGFRIYRRDGDGAWDGTLSGFTQVGTAGQNAETWEDVSLIADPVLYAVVAYNSGGESLPRTSAQFGDPSRVVISGPSSGFSGVSYTWTANATQGTAPYSYTWYFDAGCTSTNLIPIGTGPSVTASPGVSGCLIVIAQGADGAGGYGEFPVSMEDPPNIHQMSIAKPVSFAVSNASPNPFNPATTIDFSLPTSSQVDFVVYDVRGLVVHQALGMEYGAGPNRIIFNGSELASGVYYYQLTAGTNVATRKMTLIK